MNNYAEYLRHLTNGRMDKSEGGLEEIANHVEALEARVKVLGVENMVLRESLDAAEAELARLKAQEPVAYTSQANIDALMSKQPKQLEFMTCDKSVYRNPVALFTQAAPAEPRPAVLPPKMKVVADTDALVDFVEGFNACHDQAIALGCQPKRFVVKMPPVQRIGDSPDSDLNDEVFDAEETREAIRAAGGEIAE